MAELKGKYAPYFDLIVDSSRNKITLKCKLCSGGSTLAYHGNTSLMKSHLEAKTCCRIQENAWRDIW